MKRDSHSFIHPFLFACVSIPGQLLDFVNIFCHQTATNRDRVQGTCQWRSASFGPKSALIAPVLGLVEPRSEAEHATWP